MARQGASRGADRLRTQLRDTAQGGQQDEYSTDRIEDGTVNGLRRVEHEAEQKIRKTIRKQIDRRRQAKKSEQTQDAHASEPVPKPNTGASTPAGGEPTASADYPSSPEPSGFGEPGGTAHTPPKGRPDAVSNGESPRELIKTKEPSEPWTRGGQENSPTVRTRETVRQQAAMERGASPEQAEHPTIKTRENYLKEQLSSGESPQAPGQGQISLTARERRSMLERNRNKAETARKQELKSSQTARSHTAAQQRGAERSYQAQQRFSRSSRKAVQKSARQGAEIEKNSTKIVMRSAKSAERATQKTVKTAEKTAKQTVKTAEKAVKTAQKTAQATAQAAKKAAEAARAAAQQAAKAAEAAAKAIAAMVKAIIEAIVEAAEALGEAIAAGGWVAVVIIIAICLVAALIFTVYGIFFSGEDSGTGYTMPQAITQLNGEFTDRIEQIKADNTYDVLEMDNAGTAAMVSNWNGVLAVYAVRTAMGDEPMEAVTVTEEKLSVLEEIFWDMNTIFCFTETISSENSGEGDGGEAEDTVVLHITVTVRDYTQMADVYNFTQEQREMLAELMKPEYQEMFMRLTGSYQSIALSPSQVQDIVARLPDDLSETRKQVVLTAYQLLGRVNYFWGGKSRVIGWDSRWGTPAEVTSAGSKTTGTVRPFGLDCSGYVDWVFYNVTGGAYIIGHGGGAAKQHTYCTAISWSEAQPGDLVFYPSDEHVGIVCGYDANGDIMVIHCSGGHNNVVVTGISGFTSIGKPVFYGE